MYLLLLLLLQKRAGIGITGNQGRRYNKLEEACCGEVRAQQSFCDGPAARGNRDAPSVSVPARTADESLHDAAVAIIRLANANARLHAATDVDGAVADARLPDAVAVLAADPRLSGVGVPAADGP